MDLHIPSIEKNLPAFITYLLGYFFSFGPIIHEILHCPWNN